MMESWRLMNLLNNILLIILLGITAKAQDTLYLKTIPDDVYVMKKDSLIGHTPLFISPRLGDVVLTKTGYQQKEIDLSGYDNNPVSLKFVGRKTPANFFESSVFRIFVSSIVVLGGITAWYKVKADKKYADYQSSGDGNLLNETRRYDLVSGISFAALQINFGFLIYYFLND
jgi:hypothetical protein